MDGIIIVLLIIGFVVRMLNKAAQNKTQGGGAAARKSVLGQAGRVLGEMTGDTDIAKKIGTLFDGDTPDTAAATGTPAPGFIPAMGTTPAGVAPMAGTPAPGVLSAASSPMTARVSTTAASPMTARVSASTGSSMTARVATAQENGYTPLAPQSQGTIPLAEGASRVDDEGCIGGSIEHGHVEAEGNEAYALLRKSSAADEAYSVARGARHLTAGEMRRAVIMSEILGAPVALRGRTARR